MLSEEEKGLLAYAVDRLDLSPVHKLEISEQAIERILQDYGPKTALRCIPFNYRRYSLLRHLDRLTKGAECRPEFVVGLISLLSVKLALQENARPSYAISPVIARELIRDADDLALLIENRAMPDPITVEEYAFIVAHLNTDAYWLRRVHHLIGRGDFRRTWDELRRASTGWPRESGEIRYCFNATSETVGLLADELYSAMQHSRCIESAGLRQPHQWQMRRQRRLTELCKQDRWFAVQHLCEGTPLETATLADVEQEGLVLMHLAAHFRGQRDTRRASKKHTRTKTTSVVAA
ncbi:MAG: hypothetical protein WC750_03670 [Patescibacteria group bacterium]|jgi:hypothetical protein